MQTTGKGSAEGAGTRLFVTQNSDTGRIFIDTKPPDCSLGYEILAEISIPNDAAGERIVQSIKEAFFKMRTEMPEEKMGRVLIDLLVNTFFAGAKWGQANPKTYLG